jgi:DNA-binding IclR family transcriptional regulator
MSYLSENEINLIIKEKGLEKYTENTITNKEELEKEFLKIRKQGYAVDNMEHEVGIRCIAAPIYDYTGKAIASMSISGPSVRITADKDEEYAKMLVETCRVISKELGYMEGRKRQKY